MARRDHGTVCARRVRRAASLDDDARIHAAPTPMSKVLEWFATTALGRGVIVLALLAAVVGAAEWHGHHRGWDGGVASMQAELDTAAANLKNLTASYQAASAKAEAAALAKEQAQSQHMAQTHAYYEQELSDAKGAADRTIANLRADNLRLREQWRGCTATASVPGAAASAGGPDDATDGRNRIALDLFRAIDPVVQRQDAKIRALQAIVKADRQ
jgi:hypothetical protein